MLHNKPIQIIGQAQAQQAPAQAQAQQAQAQAEQAPAEAQQAPAQAEKAQAEQAQAEQAQAQAEKAQAQAEQAPAQAQQTQAQQAPVEQTQVQVEQTQAQAAQAEQAQAPVEQTPAQQAPSQQAIRLLFNKMRENPEITKNIFEKLFITRTVLNPAINENKFATGGVAELALIEHINKCGFRTENLNKTKTAAVVDLRVYIPLQDFPAFQMDISVKNSGNISSCPILENYRGKKQNEIRELPPTIIIYTDMKNEIAKYVYMDYPILRVKYPLLNEDELNNIVYTNSDSNLSFKSSFVKKFITTLDPAFIVDSVCPKSISINDDEKKNLAEIILDYINTIKAKVEY